jgi:hypothetical protein
MEHPEPNFDPNYVFPMLKKIRGRVTPNRRQAKTDRLLGNKRALLSTEKPSTGMSLLAAFAKR